MVKRHALVAISLAGIAIAGAIIVMLLPSSKMRASSAPASASTGPSVPIANIRFLERSLNSPTKSDQAPALAVELRNEYLQQSGEMLPPGRTALLEPNTSRAFGKSAEIVAKVGTASFVVRLVMENGQWLIISAAPK